MTVVPLSFRRVVGDWNRLFWPIIPGLPVTRPLAQQNDPGDAGSDLD